MIDEKRLTDNLIFNEFNTTNQEYWFKYTRQKFLHSIDTFYYSVKLDNDLTRNSEDIFVKRFREYFDEIEMPDYVNSMEGVPLSFPGLQEQLNLLKLRYGYFYNICLDVPDMFTFFMADTVPSASDDEGDSVTSEIIVQIRARLLWELGAKLAFDKSMEVLKVILDYFQLTISKVQENRCDYCWHSNYLQNPSQFFRIDNMIKMKVTRYKDVNYHYEYKPNDEYENDYIAHGKRSDKVFLRIYLKSKEIIDASDKTWFFQIWFFQGLISRYDLYVMEECYKMERWSNLDKARIKYYLEYGSDAAYKSQCKEILDGTRTISPNSLNKLADKLTPKVTLVTNVEFQTMRKSSKSYILKEFKNNTGPCKRVYDYLDNRSRIIEYLTHDTFRLVQPEGDVNKSRRDYCNFWKRLRQTRLVDTYIPKAKIKLVREYSRNLNKEVVKSRFLHGCITYGLYERGINDDSVYKDVAAAILRLNDNDIHNMIQYKEKKKQLLNKKLYDTDITGEVDHEFRFIDLSSGEAFDERS